MVSLCFFTFSHFVLLWSHIFCGLLDDFYCSYIEFIQVDWKFSQFLGDMWSMFSHKFKLVYSVHNWVVGILADKTSYE